MSGAPDLWRVTARDSAGATVQVSRRLFRHDAESLADRLIERPAIAAVAVERESILEHRKRRTYR